MNEMQQLVRKQKQFFHTNGTKSLSFRKENLRKLRLMIQTHEQEFIQALKEDLNKPEFEAYATEIGFVLAEIRHTLKHLDSWAKPRKVKTPVTHVGSSSYIYPEPYGVALIISPWNYPFQLVLSPLIGAMAAGNCAVLKPSEFTPHTSQLLERLVKEYFPEEYIYVVQGTVEETQALLKEKFDYIFFTGSTAVGKIIMKAAAEHLTPVTLELGGKSPCIVHEDAHLKLTAKRIVWGKYLNAGQTCIAPDYLLVHRSMKDQLLQEMKSYIHEFYGDRVLDDDHFPHIVSDHHFERLQAMLNHVQIVHGGGTDQRKRLIEPTIVDHVSWEDPLMEEEIFGPVLPIVEYENLPEMIEKVKQRPKPLALYLFATDQQVQQKILNAISFGGGCINDTIYHIASPHLPFGGVGESGKGSYHGKSSFETFSHEKSVLKQTTSFDLPFRYPQTKHALQKIKWFLK